VSEDIMPGMHYHWPWPIERIKRPGVTAVRSLVIPFRNSPTAKSEAGVDNGELLTGDENLVQATLQIQYIIKKPQDYLTSTADPDAAMFEKRCPVTGR
jgi:membrane protease subunit HflK